MTSALEWELQREGDHARITAQQTRTGRDVVDRHETDSRLMMIKVRSLEGVASTVEAVVR